MTYSPKVSGIIAFLNEERFIEEAISSVFDQNYQHWELLLVDRGSSDNSGRIAERIAAGNPTKLRYLQNTAPEQRGLALSCNLGVGQAKGEHIAFLEPNDVWLPAKLDQQTQLLAAHQEVAMVYGRTQIWHSWTGKTEDNPLDYSCELGVRENSVIEPPRLFELQIENLYQTAVLSDALISREIFNSIGGFEQALGDGDDIRAFFAKVLLGSKVFVAGDCWTRSRRFRSAGRPITENDESRGERIRFLKWSARYVASRRDIDSTVRETIQSQLDRNSIDGIQRVLVSQFPEFEPLEIEYLGEGLNNRVYRVNREYVFRFPRHDAAECSMDIEIRLLSYLRHRVSLPIPDCRYIANRSRSSSSRSALAKKFSGLRRSVMNRLRAPTNFAIQNDSGVSFDDRLFVGYREISGSFLYPEFVRQYPEGVRDRLAAEIGGFLSELHKTPTAAVSGFGVREIEFGERYFQQHLKLVQEQIVPALGSANLEVIVDGISAILDEPPVHDYRPSLVHGDLGWDHIIYNEDAHCISGIIDFGGAFIGDPGYDFLEIKRRFDGEFVGKVMRAYGHQEFDRLLRKVELLEICSAVSATQTAIVADDEQGIQNGLRTLHDLGGKRGLRVE